MFCKITNDWIQTQILYYRKRYTRSCTTTNAYFTLIYISVAYIFEFTFTLGFFNSRSFLLSFFSIIILSHLFDLTNLPSSSFLLYIIISFRPPHSGNQHSVWRFSSSLTFHLISFTANLNNKLLKLSTYLPIFLSTCFTSSSTGLPRTHT